MKALVAITFDADRVDPAEAQDVVARARRGLAAFAGPAAVDRAVDGSHLFLSSLDDTDVDDDRAGRVAILLSRTCRTSTGQLLDGHDLLAQLAAGRERVLRALAPPFGGVVRLGERHPVMAMTDRCGIHHVYWYQGRGWAALSSSSLVLASLAGEALDVRALGIFSLVGNYLDCDTPFTGVRKLDAGSVCVLGGGIAEVQRYVPWDEVDDDVEPFSTRGEAVAEGVSAITTSVDACLAAHPAPWIELSGGLDSRAVLAAVPAGKRQGMRALTLGEPRSADVEIATIIAARCGLEHHVVDTSVLGSLSPAEALTRARTAARRRDYAVNGTAVAVLDYVEEHVDQAPRLGGLNGEFGRGVYYPGQRAAPAVTDVLASRLANWRVLTNNAVDASLFVPEFAALARGHAVEAIQRALHATDRDWLRATDELYLRQRVHRWVGNSITPAAYQRTILLPFLDDRYLTWARRADPAEKRSAKLFSTVLGRLDPVLSAMPLDRGSLSPTQIARAGPAAKVRMATWFATRARRKIVQRARRRGKAPGTTTVVADLAARAWTEQFDALAALDSADFLDHRTVRAIAAGERAASAASVGFLIDVHGMLSFLAGDDRQR